MPSDFQSARVQSWFASVQREFGPSMLIDVAYVGNRADDLLMIGNYNQAAVNNAAGTLPLQSRRPIPTFADITYVFNGGQLPLQRPAAEVPVADGQRTSRC